MIAHIQSHEIVLTSTTSDYIGMVVGNHAVAGKITYQVVTLSYGPIGAIDSPKSSQISGYM